MIELDNALSHQWEAIRICSQSQVQIEFMQGCTNCGKTLWKYGIAVTYKVVVDGFDTNGLYQVTEDILLCLDDYDDIIKGKLKIINPKGHFELVEWIDQYERKGWYLIANQLQEIDIDSIIKHTVKINSKTKKIKCNVWGKTVNDKIWVCMEKSCINDEFTNDLKSLLDNKNFNPFNTIIICNDHIGEGKQQSEWNNQEENHRVLWFVYEKSRKGWIPKNTYSQWPHIQERNIAMRRQLISQFDNDQLNLEALEKLKKEPSDALSKSMVKLNMM